MGPAIHNAGPLTKGSWWDGSLQDRIIWVVICRRRCWFFKAMCWLVRVRPPAASDPLAPGPDIPTAISISIVLVALPASWPSSEPPVPPRSLISALLITFRALSAGQSRPFAFWEISDQIKREMGINRDPRLVSSSVRSYSGISLAPIQPDHFRRSRISIRGTELLLGWQLSACGFCYYHLMIIMIISWMLDLFGRIDVLDKSNILSM